MSKISQEQFPGLNRRGKIWHMDKCSKYAPGGRLRGSTGETSFDEACQHLNDRLTALKNAALHGVRPDYTFHEAAARYREENKDHKRIKDIDYHLYELNPFIGNKNIKLIFNETLNDFRTSRKKTVGNKTINLSLSVVRLILHLAASDWHDQHGLTWLDKAPTIKMENLDDAREPYALDPDELNYLLAALSEDLAQMALFKVNVGLRDQEVCNLRWRWEVKVKELNTSVFIIPKSYMKNKQDRLVVLNKTAEKIVNDMRGNDKEYVFPSTRGGKRGKMNNSGWKSARLKAALTAIEKGKEYLYTTIDVNVKKIGKIMVAEVTGLNKDGTYTKEQYSSDDYIKLREESEFDPPSLLTKAGHYTIRAAIKREAIRLFIDTHCPFYSQFCRVRVHDLKHTCGRRLESADVTYKRQQVILGHKNKSITTSYSAPEILKLIEAANSAEINTSNNSPTLTVLKKRANI